MGRLRPRSSRGQLQAKPERLCFFVILVTHPKSYIKTTDHRDFDGKPSEWRWGRVLSWKILEFCSMGRARSEKQHFFAFFRYPSIILRNTNTIILKETVLLQTNGTDGKSLWPGIWQICASKGRRKLVTLPSHRIIQWFQNCYFLIYDKKWGYRGKTFFEQWRHQARADAWPSWIDARRQYILLVNV